MSSVVVPSQEFRAAFRERGGRHATRCFQCATCSSICELAAADAPFPRRQMLWAQWGLVDRLAADPSIWLCHQCNDCEVRCPREAHPGDAMQAIRGLMIERLAVPRALGKLLARAGRLWPVMVGVPIALWVLLIWATTGFTVPREPLVYADVVPHGLIYAVFFPAVAFAVAAAAAGARRAWSAWGPPAAGGPGFWTSLARIGGEIATHRRFRVCSAGKARTVGHLALFWGFVGAAVTSGLIIVAMYGLGAELPLPQLHPFKILGNVSAVLLLLGGAWLLANRISSDRAGASTAFDNFFLGLVLALIVTGIGVELGRYFLPPAVAIGTYVVHLGVVLTLFLSFPYSKFAHMLYRALAMVHERMREQEHATTTTSVEKRRVS